MADFHNWMTYFTRLFVSINMGMKNITLYFKKYGNKHIYLQLAMSPKKKKKIGGE